MNGESYKLSKHLEDAVTRAIEADHYLIVTANKNADGSFHFSIAADGPFALSGLIAYAQNVQGNFFKNIEQ